jgi:hypothetical protein
VDHIICDDVGACIASILEKMEWNAQGKGKGVEEMVDGFGLWWILVCNSVLIQSVLGQAFSWDG